MNKILIALVLCSVFFLIPAHAEIVNLNSNMDCAKADAGAGTCAGGGTGTGVGTMTFDTVTNDLNWNVSHSGLSSPISDANFHGPNGLQQRRVIHDLTNQFLGSRFTVHVGNQIGQLATGLQ